MSENLYFQEVSALQ